MRIGDKYVIEISEIVQSRLGPIALMNGSEQVALSEADIRSLPKLSDVIEVEKQDAYSKGLLDGQTDHDNSFSNRLTQMLEDGRDEAWECARRIGQCSQTDLQDMGFVIEKEVDKNGVRLDWNPSFYVIRKYAASEAMQKLADYDYTKGIKKHFVRIRAEKDEYSGKPYFSIDYIVDGVEKNGYGSKDFNLVLSWKEKYFSDN